MPTSTLVEIPQEAQADMRAKLRRAARLSAGPAQGIPAALWQVLHAPALRHAGPRVAGQARDHGLRRDDPAAITAAVENLAAEEDATATAWVYQPYLDRFG
jgi:hypothetical protein